MDAVSSVAPPALLSRTFADAAIARALHFSLSDSPVPEPSVGAADLGSYAAATTAPPTTSEPAAGGGPSRTPPSSARCRLGPAGGRAGKRRPRPSKRAPTTYISTDVATFPLMVQHVTGAQAEPQGVDAGLGLLLPPFDVDPLLPADTASAAAAHVAEYIRPPQEAAAEPQPCFPTLDSWNVMYGKNEVA